MNSVRFFIICILISTLSYAQKGAFEAKEVYFATEYKKIRENNDYDNKDIESVQFSKDFKKFISENPETLNYSFKQFKEIGIDVVTSEDKKLRFYVWDTELGGTMKSYDQIIQYSSGKQVKTVYTKDQEENHHFVSEILKTDINNVNYYLVIFNGIFSTMDQSQAVQAFTIRHNELIDSDKIFKTKTKSLNKIEANFDFFSVVDRPERPLKLIKFDHNNLYIPVVNDKGVVSNKYLIYQKNKDGFQYIGVK
ncbi:hypothetical protein VUJ46_11020 [Chryseobacterium sp. MYb264]|uniref:hypothetical protein n=1 Tax=Chryseobacterium sp. MYb264 TaxID=2745153 RepID=UPI002E0E0822|nr:hypothetical protein VUJ46_11020 [Chryseobacterium sp. MYb264]